MKHPLLTTPVIFLAPALASAADLKVSAINYDGGAWSPYFIGAGIGVLSWLTFYFSDKAIGASSFYATVAGAIGRLLVRKHTESLEYYKKNPPRLDWSVVFVACTMVGAFFAAWT